MDNPRHLTPLHSLWVARTYAVCRSAAKRHGVPFSITRDEVSQLYPADGLCPILKIPLSITFHGTQGPRNDSPSIMLLDRAKGYIPGNVVVTSFKANRLKNNATPAEILAISNFLRRHMDE